MHINKELYKHYRARDNDMQLLKKTMKVNLQILIWMVLKKDKIEY